MRSAKEDQVQPMAHNAKCKGGPGPFSHTAVGIAVGVHNLTPRGYHQVSPSWPTAGVPLLPRGHLIKGIIKDRG